jgi:uncharacterized protein YbjT (DUF2867 family)
MIVVTTPTGDIGSQLVKALIVAKQSVRVIARDPTRIAPETRDQMEIVLGSHDDEAVLMRALEGAESFFLVVPPDFAAKNINEHYLRFTRPPSWKTCSGRFTDLSRMVHSPALADRT